MTFQDGVDPVSWLEIILCVLHVGTPILAGKQLFADVTSNKLTRDHDASFGLWSYHGVAKESHAHQTSFIYNADLLTPDGVGHIDIASTVYPYMQLTSDQDQIFQEYMVLQGAVTGIDGFLIEWGYQNHSSNRALLNYLSLAEKHAPFRIAVNWCDHWLTSELKNETSQVVIEAFHSNLQYLMDAVYSSNVSLYHNGSPVIFLFGGGLTADMFREVLSMRLRLPPGAKPPLWIGSFLNFAASPALWQEWGDLLNGTFGWAPFIRRPTPANMSDWDYYGDTEDTVQYQANVSKFGSDCVSAGQCAMWCGSVSAGFDNRGCAGWGRELRYIPRHDITNPSRSTYNAQWEYYTSGQTSAEYLIIPTMNDFPEATPILPIVNSSYQALYSTAKYAGLWKGYSIESGGVILPSEWFMLYKEMQFYNRTPGVNVHSMEEVLEAASWVISQGSLRRAKYLLASARNLLEDYIKPVVKEDTITLATPGASVTFSEPPVFVNGSYFINATTDLYLRVSEDRASMLRRSNFKGLLRFQYELKIPSRHYLNVISSSDRTNGRYTQHRYRFWSKGPSHETTRTAKRDSRWEYSVEASRSEVCRVLVDKPRYNSWKNATVRLYKENQSWTHSASKNSDLVFTTDGEFLLRNISLEFTVFSKR